MRIKKILIISISAILLTAIIGTGAYAMISDKTEKEAPKKSWGEKLSEIPDVWIKKNSLMKAFDQTYNKSEDELTSYDFSSFYLNYGGTRHFVTDSTSSDLKWLQIFNDVFPVELIKKIDKNHICVVYKLSYDKDEKVENILTYVVFERQTKFLTQKDDVERAGFYECWKKTGEFYFLTNKLSSSDFDNIQVGDSVLSVCNIEPAVSSDYYYYCYSLDDTNIYFQSYRLLSDGIMVIKFKADRNTGTEYIPELSEYTVSSKTFYPYNSDDFPKEIKAVINASDILK